MAARVDLSKYFLPSSYDDWSELAQSTLGKKPLGKLSNQTDDGLLVAPLYMDTQARVPRMGSGTAWDPVGIVSAENLAAEAAAEQERGCNTIWVRGSAGPFILPDQVRVILEPGALTPDLAWAHERVEVYYDVFSAALQTAAWDTQGLVNLASARVLGINVGSFSALEAHNVGATPAFEIGCLLSTALMTARYFEAEGGDMSLFETVPLVVGVSTGVFEEVAKLRALRWVWKKLMTAIEVESEPTLHVVSARRSLASLDTWSNAIRATVQVVAGALGGASRITAYPHDARLDERVAAGARLATTSQHVLAQEAHLQAVQDPAAGSWFIDSLTDSIARQAWAEFQSIENAGGIQSFVCSGAFSTRVRDAVVAREAAYATRKRVRLGVNQFASAEPCRTVSAVEIAWPKIEGALFDCPPAYHEARGWELLQRTNRSRGLKVFLANLGATARHAPRADFVAQLFAAGGFEVVQSRPIVDVASGVQAWTESGADGYVLCGHDDDYPVLGQGVASALDAAKFGGYAGRPPNPDVWISAGVSHFFYMGADVLDVLNAVSEACHE